MSEIHSRMERLLGTQVSSAISHIEDGEAIVADCLQWNEQAFTKWIKNNQYADERDVRGHFRNLLLRAEQEIDALFAWGDLAKKPDLEQAVAFLSGFRLQQRKEAYLKDDSALYLLTKLPPAHLMGAMNIRAIEDLFYAFTALDVIALTRHTEPNEWQRSYMRALGELGSEHFEIRPIRSLVVDRAFLKRASVEAGHALKPWSVSHNKETGTLTFYTLDAANRPATPNLLVVMLFFHYYFEILRTARLASQSGEQPGEKIGARFSRIIKTTERTFSFDHPNVHSEALYWEDAIAYVSTLFPQLGFRAYLELLPCGEFMGAAASLPVSLNLIDHLWDMNINGRADDFTRPPETFLYHFREMFWSEILQTLQRLSRGDMRSAVFSQLDIDDALFTQQLLEKQGSNRT